MAEIMYMLDLRCAHLSIKTVLQLMSALGSRMLVGKCYSFKAFFRSLIILETVENIKRNSIMKYVP